MLSIPKSHWFVSIAGECSLMEVVSRRGVSTASVLLRVGLVSGEMDP